MVREDIRLVHEDIRLVRENIRLVHDQALKAAASQSYAISNNPTAHKHTKSHLICSTADY